MANNAEPKIAGISFAVWIQLITTIATVVGAFSVVHSQVEIATQNIKEIKEEIKDLKARELVHEKHSGTIPIELKHLERRITELESSRPRVQK
jgi:hypothetical protein